MGVLVTLKCLPDLKLHLLEEDLHILAEANAPAGRQAQRARIVTVVKVVHVTPIIGRRLIGRDLLQEFAVGSSCQSRADLGRRC